MQHEPLSPKIRLRATFCHLCGLTFIPITIIIQYVLYKNTKIGLLSDILFIYGAPVLGMILSTILVILSWMINKNFHPFVDSSGRQITNLMLSYSLYFIISSSLMAASCGVQTVSNSIGVGVIVMLSGLVVAPFGLIVLLMQVCLIILGSIFAWKGKVYQYDLTIKFINEQP
jgi:uncharacterized protein